LRQGGKGDVLISVKVERKGCPSPVVPANAGTHTPRPSLLEKTDSDRRAKQFPPVVMGPCVRTRACTHLVRPIDSGLG